MGWGRVVFALATPDKVDPAVMQKVLRLTAALGAELELFHCVDGGLLSHPERLGSSEVEQQMDELIGQRERQLEHHAQGLRTQGLRVRSSVRWDYPVHEGVVRHLLRYPTDLLVVQPSRHHAPWTLGYADYKMIEICPCPLLLVKTTRPYVDGCMIAAVDPFHEHEKPEALDDVILDAATVLAGALSATLLVFHACVPWARVRPKLRRQPPSVPDDAEAAYRRGVEARVTELARRHGVTRDRVELVEGYPADELPFLARRESADIVIMGAVSRSLLERIMIGHTAESLLDGLDCDMLIVKPPGFRSRVRLPPAHDIEHGMTG